MSTPSVRVRLLNRVRIIKPEEANYRDTSAAGVKLVGSAPPASLGRRNNFPGPSGSLHHPPLGIDHACRGKCC